LLDYDFLAIFICSNAFLYLLVHIPLDIITYNSKEEKFKKGAKEYPPWDKANFIKIVTVFSSLFFWLFFLVWPLLHFLGWDNFMLFFNFEIPFVGIPFQIIGLILVSFGTIIAIIGRISRGTKAISWGVPKNLTVNRGFRFVRHPLYASYCYYFIGLPLAMFNYLLFPLMLGIIGYYFTAIYEERILVEEFGEEYIEYQEEVGMLIPLIGKKKK